MADSDQSFDSFDVTITKYISAQLNTTRRKWQEKKKFRTLFPEKTKITDAHLSEYHLNLV